MKTKILVLTATFSAVLAIAQNPSTSLPPAPGTSGVFERPNQPRFGNFGTTTITNSLGQTFSPEEIASQLAALRGAIEQVTPALNAITEVYSNSTAGTQTGVVGGLAGVLGGVLDQNTNSAAGQSTNTLGRILRDAIAAATTNATTANYAQLQDFIALQTHLQAVTPIFDRLGVSTSAQIPSAIGGSENNSRTNTGSGKGPGHNSNSKNNNDNK